MIISSQRKKPAKMGVNFSANQQFLRVLSMPTMYFLHPTKTNASHELRGRHCLYWCWLQDLNPPPPDYKSGALPDELSQRNFEERNYTLFNSLEGRPVGFFCWPAIVWTGWCVIVGFGRRH